ncbi:MAG: Asp-tRNA(Asn)/Glu-tRNA(Gln) amidotransferase subunit GatC [Alphaproteobacteria bacterium]|jgi:aspartyl-tRNA(Asn)/glutamyl-tRNA(Gln) amidotransferase subunit C|nr:Asp-tRNA(Asn)/Glu-tRNA(Gln) amidotransferase subunit GatC [Alphaproteobacteria bacterium]MDP6813510.1 Asp-tRNA(Asn)/Glu-tRNA(Gln) amidotransferase subunit GatC [Alphaproteobacteria bacterium]
MSVDKATVARIAHLARIGVAEEELEPLAAELSGILQWIEQLNEVDTDQVPPMASVHDEPLRWRADRVDDGDKQDDIVANAPAGRDGFFAVPKVVE